MKTFIYTQEPSNTRGMDVTVKAYRVKQNDPIYLGHRDFVHAATKGAYAVACHIIADAGEAKISEDGYGLKEYGDTRVIRL